MRTDDDYNEAGLQDLLRAHGSAYEANLIGLVVNRAPLIKRALCVH